MNHKRRNFANYSLVAVIVIFFFTLFLLITYHKSQLVILEDGSEYKNIIDLNYKVSEPSQPTGFVFYISQASNFIINGTTKITSSFIEVLSNITENKHLSSYLIVVILVFLPFLISFFTSLYLSTKIKPERLFSFAILSSSITCFTFFSSVMMSGQGDTKGLDKLQIPLEQISAYAIFNIIFFTLLFFSISFIIDYFKNENESED